MAGINLATAWEVVADEQGDRLALQHGDTARSWVEYEDRAARLAAALDSVGIGPGDNVACALYNGNEYPEAQFAAFKVEAAPCNVNYRYVESELAYLVDNSDAKAVFFDDALTERFDAVRGQLDKVRRWIHVGDGDCPEWADRHEDLIAAYGPLARRDRRADALWILYTGGTTGHPKGVMWPHTSLVSITARTLAPLGLEIPSSPAEHAANLATLERFGVQPRQLAAAPLMHGTAGIGSLFTLFNGGGTVTLTGRTFDPHELWETVQRTECSMISIVGDVFCRPMVEALDEAADRGEPYDLTSVRSVTSSGVMWSQAVKDRLLAHARAQGSPMVTNDSLGASEGVGFAGKESTGEGDTETATFTLGPNAAVFTEEGERVQPGDGQTGLLAVTGPIPLGYYGDPVKTAETFRHFEGTRWSVPGDWASIGADGMVTLLGRGSVSINTGGEKVYPEEVEEALKLLPEVVDCNVVGVPDPQWGAAVTAVVELAEGAAPSDGDLVDRLRGSLSGFKLPKHIVRVDTVFRGPNGKADYGWATAAARDALGIED